MPLPVIQAVMAIVLDRIIPPCLVVTPRRAHPLRCRSSDTRPRHAVILPHAASCRLILAAARESLRTAAVRRLPILPAAATQALTILAGIDPAVGSLHI